MGYYGTILWSICWIWWRYYGYYGYWIYICIPHLISIILWGYYGVLWYYIKIGIHNIGMMGVLWYYIYGVFSISQYTSFYPCIVVVTPIYVIYEVKNGSFSMDIMGYGYHGFLEKNRGGTPMDSTTGCAMGLGWLTRPERPTTSKSWRFGDSVALKKGQLVMVTLTIDSWYIIDISIDVIHSYRFNYINSNNYWW